MFQNNQSKIDQRDAHSDISASLSPSLSHNIDESQAKKPEHWHLPQTEYYLALENNILLGMYLNSVKPNEKPISITKGYILDTSPYFSIAMSQCVDSYLVPFMQTLGINRKMAPFITPSLINNCLIRIDHEKAHVKINCVKSPSINFHVRSDELVMGTLIDVIEETTTASYVAFNDETFEPNTGVLFLFTWGWRRFLYIDFKPLYEPNATLEDMSKNLAIAINSVLFPELDPADMELLSERSWFPFGVISYGHWAQIIARLRNNQPWEELRNELIEFMTPARLGNMIKEWRRNTHFSPVVPFASNALRNYLDGDFAACTLLIWPMVERLMADLSGSHDQNEMLSHIEQTILSQLKHLGGLMPMYFQNYLKNCYFKNFDNKNSKITISRHSIAHGALDFSDLTQEIALIGLLILDQFYRFLWAIHVGRESSFQELL